MVEATQALQQLLAGLGEAARFESVGQVSAVLPGLEVKGIGSIGVPVAPADAKRIIGKARPGALWPGRSDHCRYGGSPSLASGFYAIRLTEYGVERRGGERR